MGRYIVLGVFIIIFRSPGAQELIRNGSFEGHAPFYSSIPHEWYICDKVSTPDIQPISTERLAFDGNTYLGLITRIRARGTAVLIGEVESIYQELQDSLIPGQEYHIRIHLMYEPNHKPSFPLQTGPTTLKIFLGQDSCETFRLLWHSDLIAHETWEAYAFTFQAHCGDRYLKIQTGLGDTLNYDVNYLMIDDFSLQPAEPVGKAVDCDDLEFNSQNPTDTSTTLTLKECTFYAPNVFTPNGDGVNDVYKIYLTCNILSFQMQIFNRWGNLVFVSKNHENGWTGSLDGHWAEEGVYPYQIFLEYIDESGDRRQINHANTLTLIQ
jgi:gliding motility-associated-like protein